MLDNILACKEDTPLLLCIKKSLNAQKKGIPADGARHQRQLGIAGDVCKISGEQYICLKVEISLARAHNDLLSGAMQMPKFKRLYN